MVHGRYTRRQPFTSQDKRKMTLLLPSSLQTWQQPPTSQEESAQRKVTLPLSWSWISSLQKGQTADSYHVFPPLFSTGSGSLRKLIYHPCLDCSRYPISAWSEDSLSPLKYTANKLLFVSVPDFIQVLALALIYTLVWKVFALSFRSLVCLWSQIHFAPSYPWLIFSFQSQSRKGTY